MVLRASYKFARNFKFMCGVLLKELGLWSYMLYKVLFEHVLSAKEKVFSKILRMGSTHLSYPLSWMLYKCSMKVWWLVGLCEDQVEAR